MEKPRGEILKDLIRDSGLPLLRIAREAGVPDQALYRWVTGRTEKYDIAAADKVMAYLKGRGNA